MEIQMPKRLEKPQLGVKVVKVATVSCIATFLVLVISRRGELLSEEPDGEIRDDLSPKGVCAAEIRRLCKHVSPGQAAWLHCLSNHLKTGEASEHGVSTKCKEDIRAFKRAMYRDIQRDKKMLAACSEELEKLGKRGNLEHIRRMRTSWEPLSDACAAEVFRAQLDFADDFILDTDVGATCVQQVQGACKNVTGTRGQVQNCLRGVESRQHYSCLWALQKQEIESFTDIRLNFTFYEACLSDIKAFCPHVDLGKELVTECLEEHRLDRQFSSRCKEEFDWFMQRRAQDEQLNAGITRDCKSFPESQAWFLRDGVPLSQVAYRFLELRREYMYWLDSKCLQQYRQNSIRASEDYRFDRLLSRSCTEERGSLCKPVADGGGHVLACFKEKRDYLGIDCEKALKDHELHSLLDLDYDFLLGQACSQELGSICKNVSKFDGAPLACLLENMNSRMGSKCKEELKERQRLMARDFRYNFPLLISCSEQVERIYPEWWREAESEDKYTLASLAANITKISSLTCKMEVWAFQKQMVQDITLDVSLQTACQADMGQLCPAAGADHGQTLACLRSNPGRLSQSCKVEEERFSKMEAHLAAEDAHMCLGICGAQEESNENSDILRARIQIPYDLPRSGACAADIKKLCGGVTHGPAAWLDCLSSPLKASYATRNTRSNKCKHEIRAFKMKMYRDIRMDRKIMTACFQELMQYCTDSPSCLRWTSPPWQNATITMEDCSGTIATGDRLACLRDTSFSKNMSDACATEVLRAKMDAAHDFELDASLNDSCSSDATWFCKDVPSSGGRVQKCLREHEAKLANECQLQLERQEVENAIDLRLNVPLYEACLKDTKTFCSHVAPGDVLLADCLAEHRLHPRFSHQCKEEMESFMQRRSEDVRLDAAVHRYCKNDTGLMCNCFERSRTLGVDLRWTFECLQDCSKDRYNNSGNHIGNPKCTERVSAYAKRGIEDIRFNRRLYKGCQRERGVLCKDVPDGGGQVFRCLQLHRSELLQDCAKAVRAVEEMMSEDPSTDYLLNEACTEELGAICKDVPTRQGEKLSCLLEKVEEVSITAKCKKELKVKQEMMVRDFSYNYPLSRACSRDLGHCSVEGEQSYQQDSSDLTTFLTCLYRTPDVPGRPVIRHWPIHSPACKLEVLAFQKQVLRDPWLDISLQSACDRDIEKLCSDVTNNHNKTLACLRRHKDQLTPQCAPQVVRFNVMEEEATNPNLLSPLERRCGPELRHACSVASTEEEVVQCLLGYAEHEGDLSPSCKAQVVRQLALQNESQALVDRVKEACSSDLTKSCSFEDKDKLLTCLLKIAAWNPFDLTAHYKRRQMDLETTESALEDDAFVELSPACLLELAHALNQTLQAYRLDSSLTESCDPEVLDGCPTPEIDPETGVLVGALENCVYHAQMGISDVCARVLAVAQNSSVAASWNTQGFAARRKGHASAHNLGVIGSTSLVAQAAKDF